MTEERASRRPGRPRAKLIHDPAGARERGRQRLRERQRDHARNPTFDGKVRKPPKAPTDRFDRGLIHASNAGLIAPQSIEGIARRARRVRAGLARLMPALDADQAAELYEAIDTVRAIRRKRGLPARSAYAPEIREVLLLLFDENVSDAAIRQRRKRLRDRRRGR